jgi:ABC-type uncharacterized transport system permease subunit
MPIASKLAPTGLLSAGRNLAALPVESAQSKTSALFMSNQALHLLTFVLYSVLAILFWRAQAAGNAEQQNRGALGFAVIVPLALHGWLLYDTLFIWGALNLGLVYALSLILWLTVLVYWLARSFYPLSSLQTLVLPLAAVSTALPAIFPDAHILSQPASALFDTHVLMAMLAYSLFTIAALHAALMSLVEKRLHHAKLPKVLHNLPPLLTMETLLFRVIGVGFVLLTITVISGMLFSEKIFGHPLQFSHMVLFGILSWMVFAVLLLGRHFKGWRGHTAVRWTLSGFGFLVLAYLGTRFVLEVILQR